MDCPKCNAVLSMTALNHIEIDYCMQCRESGWREGGLDKITERSGLASQNTAPGMDIPQTKNDLRKEGGFLFWRPFDFD